MRLYCIEGHIQEDSKVSGVCVCVLGARNNPDELHQEREVCIDRPDCLHLLSRPAARCVGQPSI